MSNRLNIVYLCNDLYAMLVGVSLTSCCENNKDVEDLRFYIINDVGGPKIKEENQRKLQEIAAIYYREICFYETGYLIKKLESKGVSKYKNTYTPYFKLFLGDMLPDEVQSVLYIDADTIVLGNLMEYQELAEQFSENISVIGVKDVAARIAKENYGYSGQQYINTGVLYFRLKQYREHNCEKKIIRYMERNHKSFRFADQDLLNLSISEEIGVVDLKFNFLAFVYELSAKEIYKMYHLKPWQYYSQQEIDKAKRDIRIVHYVDLIGHPWEQNTKCPLCNVWMGYHKKSLFQSQNFPFVKRCMTKRVGIQIWKLSKKLYCAIFANKIVQKVIQVMSG